MRDRVGVEAEAGNGLLGARATAGRAGLLQDGDVAPLAGQVAGGDEPVVPRTDDDNFLTGDHGVTPALTGRIP